VVEPRFRIQGGREALVAYGRRYVGVLFRGQWSFVEARGSVLSTVERDVALFRRTKNMVEPRFRVKGQGEALVARCRRYSAIRASIHDRDKFQGSGKSGGGGSDKSE